MLRFIGVGIGGALAGAWLIYDAVGWWLGVLGFSLALAALPSFFRFSSRSNAAWNSLLAKATFEKMAPEQQKRVMDEVIRVMTVGAAHPHSDPERTLESMPESAKFGFVALALANLNTPPPVGEKWFDVGNPYTAILGAEKELQFVRAQLRDKHGIEVSMGE